MLWNTKNGRSVVSKKRLSDRLESVPRAGVRAGCTVQAKKVRRYLSTTELVRNRKTVARKKSILVNLLLLFS